MRGLCVLLLLGSDLPAWCLRLVSTNSTLLLDGSPHQLHAVLYTPTPWGFDKDLFYQTPHYEADYDAIFTRDLNLMQELGANAIRIHGFLSVADGGQQHKAFLDAAATKGMSVLVSYDLIGTGRNAQTLSTDLVAAVADLKFFVRAVKHPAAVLLILGEAVNRGDKGFVCPDNGQATSGCQFDQNVDAFADAIEALCQTVHLEGDMACTAPFANLNLPASYQEVKFSSSHTPRGVVDWFEALAPRLPSMDIFSADLTPNNQTSNGTLAGLQLDMDFGALGSMALKDAQGQAALTRPFIVASYGIDAYDSNTWYAQAGAYFGAGYPIDPTAPSAIASLDAPNDAAEFTLAASDGVVASAIDQTSQAVWLVHLATELERHYVRCSLGATCKGPTLQLASGGVVRSFRDEWWRAALPASSVWAGGYASSCGGNDVCEAMAQLCPGVREANARNQSMCGAPFAGVAPDGYVNEEYYGLTSLVPSCACAESYQSNASQCTAASYVPTPRRAYYDLQALWQGTNLAAAKAAAEAIFAAAIAAEDPTTCAPPAPPPHLPCNAVNGSRLQRDPWGGLGLYLDCQPFLMRGMAYSPAPLGKDPGYSEPWGDYFTTEYAQIYGRDLELISNMGANTLRLYSFKTSVRHTHFLDACQRYNLSVMVAFDVGAATQTSLATVQDVMNAKARLRRQIKASKHPAIILWFIGNELNGAWHLFVCDEEYAEAFLQPTYGISQCQFGTDAAAFMRAIDNLCSVADEEGIPCATPLADAALPTALSSLPQYDGRGVLGWMKLMDGSSPEYTLHHMDVWALNLYPGRNFTNAKLFENYGAYGGGPRLPVLVVEYGVDALDTNAWYAYHTTAPQGGLGGDLDVKQFVRQEMQADWTTALVEDLERHAVTCVAGCRTKVVSGGCLIAWTDEAWKGRVIDSVATDARSAALAPICPDLNATYASPCGYPSSGQPDTFVNEEWYACRGLNHGLALLIPLLTNAGFGPLRGQVWVQ